MEGEAAPLALPRARGDRAVRVRMRAPDLPTKIIPAKIA